MHFLDRIHPERGVGGFTKLSGTVLFYNFVKAAMARTGATKVLDFGAGRGGTLHTERAWVRQLQDLRQLGAQVCAADIDPVVRQHPASDEQVVLERDGPLPFADESFDVIVSDWTFEHVEEPAEIAAELLRILRPGASRCPRRRRRHDQSSRRTDVADGDSAEVERVESRIDVDRQRGEDLGVGGRGRGGLGRSARGDADGSKRHARGSGTKNRFHVFHPFQA